MYPNKIIQNFLFIVNFATTTHKDKYYISTGKNYKNIHKNYILYFFKSVILIEVTDKKLQNYSFLKQYYKNS